MYKISKIYLFWTKLKTFFHPQKHPQPPFQGNITHQEGVRRVAEAKSEQLTWKNGLVKEKNNEKAKLICDFNCKNKHIFYSSKQIK